MEHSIKFSVYVHMNVCMQFCPWRTENSVRFAYISVCVDGK